MQSDHIFYYRSKLIFQHSILQKCIKSLGVSSQIQIEKSYSFIIVLKTYSDPFLTKKVVKKGYSVQDHIRVFEIGEKREKVLKIKHSCDIHS